MNEELFRAWLEREAMRQREEIRWLRYGIGRWQEHHAPPVSPEMEVLIATLDRHWRPR